MPSWYFLTYDLWKMKTTCISLLPSPPTLPKITWKIKIKLCLHLATPPVPLHSLSTSVSLSLGSSHVYLTFSSLFVGKLLAKRIIYRIPHHFASPINLLMVFWLEWDFVPDLESESQILKPGYTLYFSYWFLTIYWGLCRCFVADDNGGKIVIEFIIFNLPFDV